MIDLENLQTAGRYVCGFCGQGKPAGKTYCCCEKGAAQAFWVRTESPAASSDVHENGERWDGME